MEFSGYGVLPEDLMSKILFILDLKTAFAILISSKYWYKKFTGILNHDTIVINNDTSGTSAPNFPRVITVKRGRIVRYGDRYYWRSQRASNNDVKVTYFDTVAQLDCFIRQFHSTIKEGLDKRTSNTTETEDLPVRFWMRIQNSSRSDYYSSNNSSDTMLLSPLVMKQLYNLINAQKREFDLIELDAEHTIRIEIFERLPDGSGQNLYTHMYYITFFGEVLIRSFMINCGHEDYFTTASTDLYKQLKEMIVHKKHIINKGDFDDSDLKFKFSAKRAIFAFTKVNRQKYWIAEYDEVDRDNGSEVKKTIARRPDVVKNFVKLLEMNIYDSKIINNPHFNHKEIRKLPPPQSVLYNLAKRFPYNIDLLGLPATFFISVKLKRRQVCRNIIITCYDNGPAPIEATLELFHFVEAHLDPVTNPQPFNESYQVGTENSSSKPITMSLEIDSLSVFERIKHAKKVVVQRIWSFIQKFHSDSIPE